MSTSYNGYPASRDPSAIGIVPMTVAGRAFPGGVKKGAVATVLKYVAAHMHWRVESLYAGEDRDDYGYAYRANVNNPSQLSCHASGTAIDVNATSHPNGRRNTFTYAQVKAIRHILKETGYAVHWGGDFSTTKDEMHFEIAPLSHVSSAQLRSVAAKLVTPEWYHRDINIGTRGSDVRFVRRRMGLSDSDLWTPGCGDAMQRLRAKLHLTKGTGVSKGMAFYIGRNS